ncbi:MAG: hypothetical protein IPP51_10420 [Bacteroidetes bacterium]|nr:hypothetical protein [Bacteroidota bacterium]
MIQLRTILTSLLLTISTFCHAYNLEPNRWTSYEGKLGQSLIHLSLYRFDNGKIKGSYCYQNYEIKILLSGQISDDKIVLTEFLADKPNGSFEGSIFSDSTDRFEGIWHDSANTKSIEFKLKLSGICGSNFSHVYSDMFGPDEAVENFMKHVKTSIQNGEKSGYRIMSDIRSK